MGKVYILNTVYNVTEMFKAKGAALYTSAQGYTVSSGVNRIHFITSLKSQDNVAVAHVMGKQETNGEVGGQYSKGRNYGHANDCAYYDSVFFIVQGGGKKVNSNEDDDEKGRQIIRLNNSLKELDPYNYNPLPKNSKKIYDKVEEFKTITGIAHISGKYFALCCGMGVSICELNKSAKTMQEISRFKLSGVHNNLSRSGCELTGQGIYCTNSKLYKVFSYRDSLGAIRQNDIGVFKFDSTTPSQMTKASLTASYSCDQPKKDSFEVESLGSPDGGTTMYMLANVAENGAKDKLYQVSFS